MLAFFVLILYKIVVFLAFGGFAFFGVFLAFGGMWWRWGGGLYNTAQKFNYAKNILFCCVVFLLVLSCLGGVLGAWCFCVLVLLVCFFVC